MKVFVSESLSSAILDSGATATVSGKVWMECYLDSLSEDDRSKVVYAESANSFKFGSGDFFKSIYKVKVPALIGSHSILIESDVVDTDIPMLLSRSAMKKADTYINFKDDSVTMLGEKQNVMITSSGHYSLPLTHHLKVLDDVNSNHSKVTLNVKQKYDLKDMAIKLHSQFSHPKVDRLIRLVQNSGWEDKRGLLEMIQIISAKCTTCKEYDSVCKISCRIQYGNQFQ